MDRIFIVSSCNDIVKIPKISKKRAEKEPKRAKICKKSQIFEF